MLCNNRTVFSVRGLCSVLIREVNSDAKPVQGSYEWILAAEAREQASKEIGAGSFWVEEELEIGLWRRNVWLEVFIYV
jgi:hypothetical protein